MGELEETLAAYGVALLADLRQNDWGNVIVDLNGIANFFSSQNRLAKEDYYGLLAFEVAALQDDEEELFLARLDRFSELTTRGQWKEAEALWQLLEPMGRAWLRALYRPGNAEYLYARFRFAQGTLREEHLAQAEQLAKSGKSRYTIRSLHHLRGEWRLEQGQWALAADSLHEAVRMAREIGQPNVAAEAMLSLANFHLGQLPAAHEVAAQLAKAKEPPHRALAALWLAIGEREQARRHALAAYKMAWSDGEPHVYRYELNKTRALLEQLDAEIPNLPPYDPTKEEKLPWEDEVTAAIEKLRAEAKSRRASQIRRIKKRPPL
jgi:hypothetical protein